MVNFLFFNSEIVYSCSTLSLKIFNVNKTIFKTEISVKGRSKREIISSNIFKAGDVLTVNRHCFLFCLYYFYIFQENLRFFFLLVVSIFFLLFPFLFLMLCFCFLIWMVLSLLFLFLSLSYLGICLMLRTTPPQFPPPPLFFEICSFVRGGTRWMEEEEKRAFNPYQSLSPSVPFP